MIQVTEYSKNFYVLDDNRVRQFLITGDKNALLIDTGFEDSHVIDTVRHITELPVTVLMTHGDMDHAGGLKDFGKCYLNEKDWNMIPEGIELLPLNEGDSFECGGYNFEIIEIPGHTYGSIALFDRDKKLLLPGDSVQKNGAIFLFGDHRNFDMYIESQKKLCSLIDQTEVIIPCHADYPVEPEYIEQNLTDALNLKDGKLSKEKHPFLPCFVYKGESTEFYY